MNGIEFATLSRRSVIIAQPGFRANAPYFPLNSPAIGTPERCSRFRVTPTPHPTPTPRPTPLPRPVDPEADARCEQFNSRL